MASPLTVTRNDYHDRPKRSDVYTPPGVARFLFDVLRKAGPITVGHSQMPFQTILDPAIGTGRLTDPWCEAGHTVTGCDIVNKHAKCQTFYQERYESLTELPRPGLVLCNPPFNGAEGRKLYPEVFLEHTFDLFGVCQPMVLFAPMGMRLNQRRKSSRWRWLRDCGAELASIVSLPLDTFPGVEFHAEILIFNVGGIRPHYFLPENALQ
jgi:type I restriction enzyme M protein